VVATPVGRPPKEIVESFHHFEAGKTRDKIGAFAGVSGRTVEKIGTEKRSKPARQVPTRYPERRTPAAILV
jgi:hypothetical protein